MDEKENLVFTAPASPLPGGAVFFGNNPEEAPLAQGPACAGFNERFLAYVIDLVPFVVLCYRSFNFLVTRGLLGNSSSTRVGWLILWTVVYLVYQTVFSSGGRATLGKLAMAIRVRDTSGEGNLSPAKALARALAYFLSAFLLNIGFFMSLFTRDKRALHDYLAGSRVIRLRERGTVANGLILAVSWSLMVIFCLAWLNIALKMSPEEKQKVVAAYTTISKLKVLEERYFAKNGEYTNDLKELANIDGNAAGMRAELISNLAPGSLSIAGDGSVFVITARAANWRETEISVASPQTTPWAAGGR